MAYIKSGKEQGANVHLGGERVGEEGYFIAVLPPFDSSCFVWTHSPRFVRLANDFHGDQARDEDRPGGDLRPRRRCHQVRR